jgi:glucan phosphoethanolaminetransferase (alkaline phosphatase superfamily)
MPEQLKEAKPQRMHGIVPTPYAIPKEHLPQRTAPGSQQPFFVTLIVWYLLLRAGTYIFLALVPWGDPESGMATFLIAHRALVFDQISMWVNPHELNPAEPLAAFFQRAVFLFLALGLIFLASAWKMWTLDKFWVSIVRWGMIFLHGATVIQTMIELSARYVGGQQAPLSEAMRTALFIDVAWNLLICGFFAMFPDVEGAYDRQS